MKIVIVVVLVVVVVVVVVIVVVVFVVDDYDAVQSILKLTIPRSLLGIAIVSLSPQKISPATPTRRSSVVLTVKTLFLSKIHLGPNPGSDAPA